MKKIFLFSLFLFLYSQSFGQEKFDVHSYEKDSFTHKIRYIFDIKGIFYDTLYQLEIQN